MEYDFRILAGDSGTEKNDMGLEFIVKDKATRQPIPLVSDTIVFVAYRLGDAVLTKSSADGGISVDTNLSKVLIPFSPTETQALLPTGSPDPMQYSYKVTRSRPAQNFIKTVLKGSFTVRGNIT
jgi:hypothetical protein